jgi:hypothetical protein
MTLFLAVAGLTVATVALGIALALLIDKLRNCPEQPERPKRISDYPLSMWRPVPWPEEKDTTA